ncbi:ATP-binding protein [Streptomyces pluripotens]|uniref:ATP-binding protein n=1 Tax=Streptomyces pluripotens TaxID=1355015 RepID=A0A221P974_9ACTN|nr:MULTISPECIES: AAA family ATPase [Streptomyces]ARP74395.1 ATP-binding protein [Streptomyces pluripotens]ASN28674.1 ATP-binding protein [Streptomyces pluripotens]KIE26155.1 ATP-binding protein [Streptomyces sp. MUSC 125]MCH0559579.1 AAA family ATPase [Streptomyces sp. MUM 16J]
MKRTTGYVTAGAVVSGQPFAPAHESCSEPSSAVVRDLRGRAGRSPRALDFGARDVVVVTGLPGSGKSTLMHRTAVGQCVDSQDTRERFAARLPRLLPYALYRPLVRLVHYSRLWHALRAEEAVVVHDCGTQGWVRGWLARAARRRGGILHLLLLDVAPEAARAGQRQRGRGVSRHAFRRHCRTTARLLGAVERGRVPVGCGSAVLLDRAAADTLKRIGFLGRAGSAGTRPR